MHSFGTTMAFSPERAEGAVELYKKFDPQDAIETVVSALTVGLCTRRNSVSKRSLKTSLM